MLYTCTTTVLPVYVNSDSIERYKLANPIHSNLYLVSDISDLANSYLNRQNGEEGTTDLAFGLLCKGKDTS